MIQNLVTVKVATKSAVASRRPRRRGETPYIPCTQEVCPKLEPGHSKNPTDTKIAIHPHSFSRIASSRGIILLQQLHRVNIRLRRRRSLIVARFATLSHFTGSLRF